MRHCDDGGSGEEGAPGSALRLRTQRGPISEIREGVVAALREIELDLGEEFPKPLADEFVKAADVVVTLGCGDACPVFPGKQYEDWQVPDPAGKPLPQVRPIRDEMERRVRKPLAELGVPAGPRR